VNGVTDGVAGGVAAGDGFGGVPWGPLRGAEGAHEAPGDAGGLCGSGAAQDVLWGSGAAQDVL
jgi:hypothetical protein